MSEDFALDVPAFADERIAALRNAAIEPFRNGDKGWLVRQHEHFLLAHDACPCVEHKCSGCKITDAIAIKLGPMIDKLDLSAEEVDYERTKARAQIKQESGLLKSKARDIAQRVENMREQAIHDKRQKAQSVRSRDHWQDKQS